ncbi:hypothetical protein GOV13_04395 [Candidatus Pacearchaeota archaeon]|nr:hypothetical protein [Candidatus Pacearchaeota archaeon]
MLDDKEKYSLMAKMGNNLFVEVMESELRAKEEALERYLNEKKIEKSIQIYNSFNRRI